MKGIDIVQVQLGGVRERQLAQRPRLVACHDPLVQIARILCSQLGEPASAAGCAHPVPDGDDERLAVQHSIHDALGIALAQQRVEQKERL